MQERIGPYEVIRELGRGGMGVVYLARDERLGRDVAIKSLPEDFASDPARLERFEREAKTLAQLSHPNLVGIHGVEEHEGARYLVLEYAEGETLADLLDRGPLGVEDAIDYATQIAAGVEAAHEAGVIHRDLKPANIKITPDGVAKVLDFGLARQDEGGVSSSGGLDSPTMTTPLPQHSPTIEGAILGTAAYMSPEQARGRRVDRRTDVWSFGVVLYETLTGSGPFVGETATDSIGAVLHKDADLDRLPASTPRALRRVIERCLERDKSRRWQAMGDVRIELEDIARRLDAGETDSVAAGKPATAWWWPVLMGAIVVALLVSTLGRGGDSADEVADADPRDAMPRVARVTQITDTAGLEQDPSLSPDGRTLLYTAVDGGDSDIFMLRVGGSNPINLTRDSDADDFDAAFSPDGERIAFVSTREGGGIFIMGATGESPRRVSDQGFDPAWSPDGRTLVYTTAQVVDPYGRTGFGALWVIDLETREQRELERSNGESDEGGIPVLDAVGPSWSPDGSRIAFWGVSYGVRDLYTIETAGGRRVRLTDDIHTDWNPVWSADGRSICYISDRGGQPGVWMIGVGASGGPAGEPAPVMSGPTSTNELALAASGDRMVVAERATRTTVSRVGLDTAGPSFVGEVEEVMSSSAAMIELRVSPDGEWMAYRSAPPVEDLFVMRADGTGRRRIIETPQRERGPRWSSDSQTITYYSNKNGKYEMWQTDRSGANPRVVLSREDGGVVTPVWSPDGRILVVSWIAEDTVTAFFEKSEDGELRLRGEPTHAVVNPLVWSRDGRRIIALAPTPVGTLAPAVYAIESGEVTPLATPDTDYLSVARGDYLMPVWIDATRVMFWEASARRVAVFDVETGDSRWVNGGVDEPADFVTLLPGEEGEPATLYLHQRRTEGELWAVELETPTSEPAGESRDE